MSFVFDRKTRPPGAFRKILQRSGFRNSRTPPLRFNSSGFVRIPVDLSHHR
jgi:hypothetical protein